MCENGGRGVRHENGERGARRENRVRGVRREDRESVKSERIETRGAGEEKKMSGIDSMMI
jgi:hypothetical protein